MKRDGGKNAKRCEWVVQYVGKTGVKEVWDGFFLSFCPFDSGLFHLAIRFVAFAVYETNCQLYVVDKCLSGEEGWFHFNLRDRWLVLLVSHRIASYQLLIIAFIPYCYYYSYSY